MKASIKMEAKRLAKNIVRDTIKRKGILISSITAYINKAAKVILDILPNLYDEAQRNLKGDKTNPIVLKPVVSPRKHLGASQGTLRPTSTKP